MTRSCRKFCVLTTGRSGSTWLMEALERFPDIALPKKQIDCIDSELLRPGGFGEHCSAYAALTDAWVIGQDGLIDTFFWYSAAASFAGFKSMPHRHESYDEFLKRPDIRFITLQRADTASAVASFLLAMRAGMPCLVHGVGGLADTVTHGVTGFVFDGGTPVLQAEAMIAMLRRALSLREDDPKSWQAMQRAAAAQRFSWRRAARAYIEELYGDGD